MANNKVGPMPPPPPGHPHLQLPIRQQVPMPPPPQHQLPIRQQVNSTRFVDLTPRMPLDEEACRKKLTTYEAYTIRRIVPHDPKEKPTWAKAEITKEAWTQEEILKAVRKLKEGPKTVAEKKQALMNFQGNQISRLLDDLKSAEMDRNFERSLVQLDSKLKSVSKGGQKSTTSMTVYVKRAPHRDINPIGLYDILERMKAERMAQMTKPPQPRPQAHPGMDGGGAFFPPSALPPGVMKMPAQGSKPQSPKRPNKKYHHDGNSSTYSGLTNDSESDSEYSSSEDTSISSRSGRHSRRYSHRGRSRSRSRRREHQKKYYVDDKVVSPDPRLHDPHTPRFVPPAPHAAPGIDPVIAAYKAGKVDAEAERSGLVDSYPGSRPVERKAIISYGHPEPQHPPGSRFLDERYGDEYRVRDEEILRREREDLRRDELRRRERDAEEYIRSRGPREHMDQRPSEPIRVPHSVPNPFTPRPPVQLPRRYPHSQYPPSPYAPRPYPPSPSVSSVW